MHTIYFWVLLMADTILELGWKSLLCGGFPKQRGPGPLPRAQEADCCFQGLRGGLGAQERGGERPVPSLPPLPFQNLSVS